MGHPSRTLEGNSRKRSESVSGVFPEFFRNFFRKVPAALGVWPITIAAKIITKKLFTKIIFRGNNFVIITKTLCIQLKQTRERPQKHYKNNCFRKLFCNFGQDGIDKEKDSGNRKRWRQTGSRQSTPLSTIRTRYGNSASTAEATQIWQNPAAFSPKKAAHTEFQYRPHIVDTDTIADAVFADAFFSGAQSTVARVRLQPVSLS